jgi:hypothetical protein
LLDEDRSTSLLPIYKSEVCNSYVGTRCAAR